jgi:hypothetical protein
MTTFLIKAYLRQDSAGIVSEVFHFPESFVRDYERMERELKVYIYRDREPGGYFQSPTELTGIYGSEAYFFKNIKESRFLTTDPLKAHFFFIPISWHQMRTQVQRLISLFLVLFHRMALQNQFVLGYRICMLIIPLVPDVISNTKECFEESFVLYFVEFREQFMRKRSP